MDSGAPWYLPTRKTLRKKNQFETFPNGSRSTNSNTSNLTKFNNMKNAPDWTHAVLQRMIVVFLGMLSLGVALQSCTTHAHTTCSAYDKIEVQK
jgi:hypothetical protein